MRSGFRFAVLITFFKIKCTIFAQISHFDYFDFSPGADSGRREDVRPRSGHERGIFFLKKNNSFDKNPSVSVPRSARSAF